MHITMKRSVTVGLLVASALTLAACGTASKPKAGAGAKPPAQQSGGAAEAKGFTEYPIGDEQQVGGLKVGLVYFQPVSMEPESKAGLKPADADFHLEADISADAKNPLGFGAGEFVPYLQVSYSIKHVESGQVQEGSFMPMNAADGSHYGANVKLPSGAGNYKIALKIKAPGEFLLHTDKVTGVEGHWWTAPLEASWDFKFVPRKW